MSALQAARELVSRSRNGHELSSKELEELATRARAEAPTLSPADGRELYETFGALLGIAEAGQRETRRALRQAGSGRRALRGYGHLKPNRRAQHIRSKV
jgi:hypothetical protein